MATAQIIMKLENLVTLENTILQSDSLHSPDVMFSFMVQMRKKREEEIFITVRCYKSENRWHSLNTVNFCPGDIHFWGARGKHLSVAAH